MLRYILFFIACFIPIAMIGQVKYSKDSIVSIQDTIILQEIAISANQKAKVSGMLTGDLKLYVDQLNSLPALTGNLDVLKLMELTPSVRTSGDGSSNMYVRGGDAGQNLILYNGITTYTPGHILGVFPLFNADHLSWVKMSKGTADAQYGDFISSIIEIESQKQIPTKFSAKGNTGLLASQVTFDVPISKNWGAYISGRKTYLDLIVQPLIKRTFSSSSHKEDTDIEYDFWDSNLSIIGKLKDNHRLSVDMMLGGDKLKINDKEIMLDGSLNWSNALASVSLDSYLSGNLQIEQIISFSHFDNKLDTKQEEMFVKLDSKIEDISYKNKFSFSIADLPVTTGLAYTYHHINPHDLRLTNSDVVTNSVKEDKIKAHALSIFASATWKPVNKLSLIPVLRYNFFTSKPHTRDRFENFHSLDARLSARYQLKENIFLRTNLSHNNQYINKLTPSSVGLPTDFWIGTTPDLKPQRGDEISLGYYHALFSGLIELSADVYYRSMKNVTQFDYNFIENDNSSFIDKISYGKGRAYGLEIMLKKNYGNLTGWLGYALSRSDRQFSEINNGKRFPARYDRIHDLSATLSYTLNPKWDIALTCIYATGNTYTQPTSWYFINNLPVKEYTEYNNARMPDYKRVDIGVNYWFKKDNGLNFSLYNIFAVKNPIYIFMVIKQDPASGYINLEMKKKKLYTIIPSISWNFKF